MFFEFLIQLICFNLRMDSTKQEVIIEDRCEFTYKPMKLQWRTRTQTLWIGQCIHIVSLVKEALLLNIRYWMYNIIIPK